ncbi:hypothetical protein BS1321_02010 [Peribacillus simplex NBRC 15720 = DSM 1321]|uniref:Uncharacterized protein n=1 Tax=Peribacillus simplex NBRC 15720 = DSM 1321 TaxID=1349754 RepID=A0A223EC61_9BACI|nr:hypothetical protein BS1321_02010 [Peribacillus simplex NBRC 15720 = DSM 1321]
MNLYFQKLHAFFSLSYLQLLAKEVGFVQHISKYQTQEFSMERTATYVFKKDSIGTWRCIIYNSYGAEIIEELN